MHSKRVGFAGAMMLLTVVALGAAGEVTFPGREWPAASPGDWSREKLEGVSRRAGELGTGGLMVVHEGRPVLVFGDVSRRNLVQSQRKPLLGAAIGVAVDRGEIELGATLAALGIDDHPPLTEAEKRATVEDLLRSRSGVYHSAIYEFPGWKKRKPERGTHAPGEAFFYNNWDFNVLGTIFEKETGRPIGDAFEEWIAKPTGMQDFRPRDVAWLTRRSTTEKMLDNESDHGAYIFHMSTRDMARFGLLYLAGGEWKGERVVSEEWVTRSWEPRPTGIFPDAYGFLWFVLTDEEVLSDVNLREPVYFATGAGGQMLVVIPELDVVVAHSVKARGVGLTSQLKRRSFGRNSVGDREFYGLLFDIVRAHPRAE